MGAQNLRMTIEEIRSKRIAVVLFVERSGKDDDILWFGGEACEREGKLVFDRGSRPPLMLPFDALHDIRFCTQSEREAFEDCELLLPLTIKEMSAGDDVEGRESTGLNLWE